MDVAAHDGETDVDGTLSRAREALAMLARANRSILGEQSLAKVLQSITAAARDLVGARYAALGVIGGDGGLVEFVHVGMDDATVERIGPLPRGGGLLGAMVHDPRPLRLEHIADDPRRAGFPAHHPPMDRLLGVPITVRGSVYGNLYLADKVDGSPFSLDDERTIRAFSVSAGVAVENARLVETSALRERGVEATRRITASLLDPDQKGDPVRLVMETLFSMTGAELATVSVTTTDPDELLVTHAMGTVPGVEGRTWARRGSIPDAALRLGRGIMIATPEEKRAFDLPATMDTVGPLLSVPLRAGGRVYGVLSVGRRPGGAAFAVSDLELAESFAAQAGVAMALVEARRDQERLAVVEDRQRIARDLHDHVIQRLFASGLTLDGLARSLEGEAAAGVDRVVDDLDVAIGQIRTLIFRLQSTDVARSLRKVVMELAGEATAALGFEPDVAFEGPVDTVADEELIDAVTVVVRASLGAVARDARASRVSVGVQAFPQRLSLVVAHDGAGPEVGRRHSGLEDLTRLAARYGGTSELVGGPAGGTEIRWSIPLR